jgi:hypothetical protein
MKIFIYIGILAIMPLSQSCSDYLELEPESGVSPGNFYKTEKDVKMALAGVYDILGYLETYGSHFWYEFGLGTDVSLVNRKYKTTEIYVYNYGPGKPELAKSWEAIYDGINRANLFIENVPNIEMEEDEKKRVLGEVHFIRGLLYFNLVRLWGGVPITTEPTKSVFAVNNPKADIADVYQQILEDMEYAEGAVYPASQFRPADNGRVCKGAVQGLLARVCLTMAGYPLKDQSKYADALKWAEKVRASGDHALNPDYRQIFINHTQDIFEIKESMFEVVFYGNRDGDAESMRFGGINSIDSRNVDAGYSYAFFNVTKKLYDMYEDTDERRDWNIATYKILSNGTKRYYEPENLFHRKPGKWRRENEVVTPRSKNFTPTNYPVLRYADVLLMLAEAENEINGPTTKALKALNDVRDRAEGASLYTMDDFEGKESFRNAIIKERALELCHEGERKMDLIRWGILIPTLKALSTQIKAEYPGGMQFMSLAGDNIEEKHLLFPIPQEELELNPGLNGQQNAGW